MQAVVYDQYGPPDVLHLSSVPIPEIGPNDVLIRIHAVAITRGDARVRSLDVPRGFGYLSRLIFGITAPRQRILGGNVSGTIDKIGSNVSQFKPGDRVVAAIETMGGYAEYLKISENGALARIPEHISFADAAAMPFGGYTALGFLRQADLKPGERILINGSSGSVGCAAVQLAKHVFGAHVTAVCGAKNAEFVRSLGADNVIDYAKEGLSSDLKYDVIMDNIGSADYSVSAPLLSENGRLILVFSSFGAMLHALLLPHRHKIIAGPKVGSRAALEELIGYMETGKLRATITNKYVLETIPEAHREIDTGHKVGDLVAVVIE